MGLHILVLIIGLVSLVKPIDMADSGATATTTTEVEFAKNLENFSHNLYKVILEDNPQENIIFSPFSIQTCAAMTRIGAEKQTAEEIDHGVNLNVNGDLEKMANGFYSILQTYEHSDIIKMANRIYLNEDYKLKPDFNDILNKKFLTSAETINFSNSKVAAENMNGWVEDKTNKLIKNLIDPEQLNEDTRLVLLNAIYFKGQWKARFDPRLTKDEDFHINDHETIKVKMMRVKDSFLFGRFPELDATAIELPYNNSDLSMLIILPNSNTGLKTLENNIKNIQLSELLNKMYKMKVVVKLPKFKTEFSMELSNALKKLGVSRMFTDDAEFGNMLNEVENIKVSKVVHKAFIDVNEEGTEAAAATAISVHRTSMPRPPERIAEFYVDKPFFYTIFSRRRQAEYILLFAGSVKNISPHSY